MGTTVYQAVSVLGKIIGDAPLDTSQRARLLVAFAKSKITFPRFPFGRYRNVPLPQVPGDYLQWMLRCSDPPFDEDICTTATAELRRRSRSYREPVSQAV